MMNLGRNAAVLTAGTAVAVLALAAAPAADAATTNTGSPAGATEITVDTGHALATVGSMATGVNDWQNDAQTFAPGTNALLGAAGVDVRELNTGPYDDTYRWRTNTYDVDPVTTADGPGTPQPWQKWVATVKPTGAQMMVHVNYGSTADDGPGGTDIGPQEAADWVRQANIVDHDGIKYWMIGEEVWGNGYFYQPPSEPDHHADLSPAAYGANVAKFAAAMKAVDPSIKIGIEAAPFAGGGPAWDTPVLKAAGSAVDFVDIHPYQFTTVPDDQVLQWPAATIPALLGELRSSITATEGSHPVQVIAGETNLTAVAPTEQSITAPSALFAADDVDTMLEQGASTVNWFVAHLPVVPDAKGSVDDPAGTGYGTWSLLSDGPKACGTAGAGNTVCAPALNTPYPAYYGYAMGAHLASPGAKLVATSGATGPIVTHAAVQRDGSLVVLVENEDPAAAHDVRLSFPGFTAAPLALTTTYGKGYTLPKPSVASSTAVHLAPYTLTELFIPHL
jgi:hypothetical protein